MGLGTLGVISCIITVMHENAGNCPFPADLAHGTELYQRCDRSTEK